MADGTRRMRKTWRVIRTGKRREERVDLRKRKISTSFSPARNHLECSRATCSRRIKVLFWEERERESERKRTVWTLASLSGNFSVNRDRRNFLYPAPLPFHHRPLQWNQVAAPVAGVVERNRFRGNERRGSMMKYSLHCATLLAIFSPVWYDRTSRLWECIHLRYNIEKILSILWISRLIGEIFYFFPIYIYIVVNMK